MTHDLSSLRKTVLDWFSQVTAHDFAEKKHIERAAMAKGVGFDPAFYTRPFPGSVPNTTIVVTGGEEAKPAPGMHPVLVPVAGSGNPVPPSQPTSAASAASGAVVPNGWSTVAKWAAATLLGGSLAGGGGLAGAWLASSAGTTPAKPVEQELQIRWWVEDGKMKSVVEPVK